MPGVVHSLVYNIRSRRMVVTIWVRYGLTQIPSALTIEMPGVVHALVYNIGRWLEMIWVRYGLTRIPSALTIKIENPRCRAPARIPYRAHIHT